MVTYKDILSDYCLQFKPIQQSMMISILGDNGIHLSSNKIKFYSGYNNIAAFYSNQLAGVVAYKELNPCIRQNIFTQVGQPTHVDEIYIGILIVSQGLRRQGFGSSMIKFVDKIAKIHSKQFLSVHVAESNSNAVAFYLSKGFLIEYKTIGNSIAMQGSKTINCFMRKKIIA